MEKSVAAALARIVRERGPSVTGNARLLEALLRDYCPGQQSTVSLLLAAQDAGVARRVARGDGGDEVRRARLAQDFAAERHIRPDAARWAVDAWVGALAPGEAEAETPGSTLVDQPPPAPPPPEPAPPEETAIAPPAEPAPMPPAPAPAPSASESPPPRPETEPASTPPPPAAEPAPGPPPPPPSPPATTPARPRSSRTRPLVAGGAAILAILGVVVAVAATRGDDDGGDTGTSTTATSVLSGGNSSVDTGALSDEELSIIGEANVFGNADDCVPYTERNDGTPSVQCATGSDVKYWLDRTDVPPDKQTLVTWALADDGLRWLLWQYGDGQAADGGYQAWWSDPGTNIVGSVVGPSEDAVAQWWGDQILGTSFEYEDLTPDEQAIVDDTATFSATSECKSFTDAASFESGVPRVLCTDGDERYAWYWLERRSEQPTAARTLAETTDGDGTAWTLYSSSSTEGPLESGSYQGWWADPSGEIVGIVEGPTEEGLIAWWRGRVEA